MMKPELKTVQTGTSQYLEYDLIKNPQKTDNDTIMMINSNQERNIGLARISFEDINGEKQKMHLDITGTMPLKEYLTRRITQEDFGMIFMKMAATAIEFDDYMIDISSIVLDPEYVYVNIQEKQPVFLCMPFENREDADNSDIYEFFRSVFDISRSGPGYTGSVNIQKIAADALESRELFSLGNLKNVLSSVLEKKTPEAPQVNVMAEPEVKFAPVGDVLYNGPESGLIEAGVPMIEMPDDTDESESLFGRLKGMFKKNDDGKDKPEKSDKKSEKGKKEKPDKKKKEKPEKKAKVKKEKQKKKSVNKSEHTDGLAALVNGDGKSKINTDIPEMQLSPVMPDIQSPAQKSASADNHTIFVTDFSAQANSVRETEPIPESSAQEPAIIVPFSKFRMVNLKANEEFILSEPVVRIGRSRTDVQIRITDSVHVGRHHAELRYKDSGYVIADLKSSNHTLLNGEELEPYKEYELSGGDRIVFADTEFEFRIS